jgi:POT family proton-dependent oligopeptide transporter
MQAFSAARTRQEGLMARKPGDTSFLGHPAGLGWLAFSEFWERFSYYGMQALLVLYMTKYLLLPGHVDKVFAFPPFRAFVEGMYGPLSPQALASAIFGLYAGLVYLTPIAGGLLADRLIGRTNAVAIGALLMAIGHFLMAFEVSFLLALLCLLVGVGCFKGNIASQVGELYGPNDHRRADAFQVFLMSVQIAVIISPLVCGTLGEKVGWHWGFGAAGVGMLIGLVTYLSGRYALPPEPKRGERSAETRAKLQQTDIVRFAVLIALLPVLAVSIVGNQEIFNAYLVWAGDNYQLVFFGETMPLTWFLSFDAAFSAATIIASVAFWRWWAKKWTEPDEISKITIGVIISSLAPLTLAGASAVVMATHQKVGLVWAVGFHLINDLGFANVLPVGIALYSRAAPKGWAGIVIGVYYTHLFMGNMFVGWLGGKLQQMPATTFWLMHVGLMLGSAAILLVVRLSAGRILAPSYEHVADEDVAEAEVVA